MKINVSEATPLQLDFLVATCEGYQKGDFSHHDKFSTNWSQGGPIIDRERISLRHIGKSIKGDIWDAGDNEIEGPTPLIAAMRCYCASKLGDTVEVPDELV